MGEEIRVRRLKSAAQVRAERKAQYQLSKQRRQEREAGGQKHRAPLVLPLVAHYAREPEAEAKRALMYALIAREYGSQGWDIKVSTRHTVSQAGYGGVGRSLRLIDQKNAALINTMASPLESLASNGHLSSTLDGEDDARFASIRLEIGLDVRKLHDDAMGLGGQDMNGTGGGGFTGKVVSDHRIDCSHTLKRVQQSMSDRKWALLKAVVIEEEWVWHRVFKTKRPKVLPKGRKKWKPPRREFKAAERIVLDIHRALDEAAVALGRLTLEQFKRRWHPRPKAAPKTGEPRRAR